MTLYSKVQAQALTAAVTGAVTWVLVTYVFHGVLPADVATALPGIVATVLGFLAGFIKKETHHATPRTN